MTIASLTLHAWDAERGHFELKIEIGTPFHAPEGEWRCPVSVTPLQRSPGTAAGDNSFQALCLALRRVQMALEYFIEDGGRLSQPEDGSGFEMESYFNVLSPAPERPPAG